MFIEINGIKMDVQEASVIESYKVGDTVKLLVKDYNSYTVNYGVIVDFVEFKARPTIVVMYIDRRYGNAEIKFAHINQDSGDTFELAPCKDYDISIESADVISNIDNKIREKEIELQELITRRKYFLERFGRAVDENL